MADHPVAAHVLRTFAAKVPDIVKERSQHHFIVITFGQRQLRDEAGGTAWLVAKIERAEAVADDETLDGLIKASDAVMVARGDLGVEIGDAELVGIQKKIILHARRHNKAVIVATQMMESMIQNPMPTRAEVSDVANAVLDYTDAVMLSAESAAGAYPLEAVQAMARICVGLSPTSPQ